METKKDEIKTASADNEKKAEKPKIKVSSSLLKYGSPETVYLYLSSPLGNPKEVKIEKVLIGSTARKPIASEAIRELARADKTRTYYFARVFESANAE